MLKKAALFLIVLLAGAAPATADVRLSMHDGLVTIVATDATVRQILAEWAKVGRATIVNIDRVAGGPITLELTNVPERQALEIILRSISGYIAAPRATAVPDASLFDRILLLPTNVQPRSTVSASSAPQQLPQPRPFQLQPAPVEIDEQVNPNVNETLPRPANQFVPPPSQPTPAIPGPGAQPPSAFGTTNPTSGSPVGSSVPGMVLQPPAQPGQQPGQQLPPPQLPPPGRL